MRVRTRRLGGWFVRMRDERGLTLTELLVTVVILGVIMVPLGNAMIGFMRLTDDTTQRLGESHDIQIAAAYVAQDVQGLGTRDWSAAPYPLRQSVELNAPATGGLYPCGTAATPDAVLRLAWDVPLTASGDPQVARVSYVVIDAAGEHQLHRLGCVGSATALTDTILVHNLDGTPVPTCSTDCAASPAVPASVTLTLNIRDPSDTGTAVQVVLSGQRRQT